MSEELAKQAQTDASGIARQFLDILRKKQVETVFQPIISLENGSIHGYEALTRTTSSHSHWTPKELFIYAARNGHLLDLEQITREAAFNRAVLHHPMQKMFINISADVINDPNFVPSHTSDCLRNSCLNPSNIVFEITERSSIDDYSKAKELLKHFRSQGFMVAIDDAGSGYSSLEAIAELRPDYIKLDRSMITNVHKDKLKEHIVELFVSFAQKLNIALVAEGIEQHGELEKVIRLGVSYAQGYFIGRPQPETAAEDVDIAAYVMDQKKNNSLTGGGSWKVGDLIRPIQCFQKGTEVSEIAEYFKRQGKLHGVVILDKKMPIGLLMRERLYQQLAGQYGYSLFWHRPVEQVMNKHPLIFEESASIDEVSKHATARKFHELNDFVIVTKDNQLAGVTSIRDILEHVTRVNLEKARVANPLTGLPGNRQIRNEFIRRLQLRERFCVCYADLDYFKWFNDTYGFQHGDEMIQYTADTLQHALGMCGKPADFLGHIGGDDFIIICQMEEPLRLCEEIIRRFDQSKHIFYDSEEPLAVTDREGNPVPGDGVTLSLSLVICEADADMQMEDISVAAARLKKKAKSQLGHSCQYMNLPVRDETSDAAAEIGG